MNNTAWKYSIQFINSLPDNIEFETKDMLVYVRKTKPHTSPTTIFGHRVILERLGFIHPIKIGLWWKLHSFPNTIGKMQAERVAFPKYNWHSWFIPAGWIADAKTQKSEVTHGRRRDSSKQ